MVSARGVPNACGVMGKGSQKTYDISITNRMLPSFHIDKEFDPSIDHGSINQDHAPNARGCYVEP